MLNETLSIYGYIYGVYKQVHMHVYIYISENVQLTFCYWLIRIYYEQWCNKHGCVAISVVCRLKVLRVNTQA